MAHNRYTVPEHVKDYGVFLYLQGMTQEQAGSKIGVNGSSLLRYLRERGVPSRAFKAHNRLPDTMRQQAVCLYIEHQNTIPEVAAILGVGTSCIARWLKAAHATRPMGEAFALAVQKGRKRWGRCESIPWQSEKTGRWEFADSRWEAVRMSQLDANDAVVTWTHIVPRIPYIDPKGKRRFYAPDFLIEYVDGSKVVEEIKPHCLLDAEPTVIKARAACAAYAGLGFDYRMVTEHNIGVDAIKSFRLEGLTAITDEQRRLAINARKAAAIKRRNAPRVNAARAKRWRRAREMTALYESGLTLAEVAARYGCCPQSVRRWVMRCGSVCRPAVMRDHQRHVQGIRIGQIRNGTYVKGASPWEAPK